MSKIRTSESDPLRVDFLPIQDFGLHGQIGLTFAPGRKGKGTYAEWDRDLNRDLDRLKNHYHIERLVCLLTRSEAETLGISDIAEKVKEKGFTFEWFPIEHGSIPESPPEFGYRELIERILEKVKEKQRTVLFCKDGLGRSGMVAASCLTGLNMRSDMAVSTVRDYRPHAITDEKQIQYLKDFEKIWVNYSRGKISQKDIFISVIVLFIIMISMMASFFIFPSTEGAYAAINKRAILLKHTQYLFSLDLSHKIDLDDGRITARLKEVFKKQKEISLSNKATLVTREEGREWLIAEKDEGFVLLNDRANIKVYSTKKIERGEEFSVPPPPFKNKEIFPCSDCHDSKEDIKPEKRKRRILKEEHTKIVLNHDSKNRWCLDCHDVRNRDKLHLANGTLVDFKESYKLCGQCHGIKLRDWRAGVHGKRTGQWNGKKKYLLCAHCHPSHSPHVEFLKPDPAPRKDRP